MWPSASGRRGRLWTLLGIPIHVDRSWFIIVAVVTWTLATGYFPVEVRGLPVGSYWAMGLAAALLLFACVLLHELGHSLTAKAYGIPVARVTLFLFGGVAQITREARRPGVELQVALAGPLVSVALAWACFSLGRVLPAHSTLQEVGVAIVRYLGLINTVILIFNLLPGFPLDGGRVLRALLWAWTGSLRQATRIACGMGSALGVGLLVLGVWAIVRGSWVGGLWYLGVGVLLRDAARASALQAERFGV